MHQDKKFDYIYIEDLCKLVDKTVVSPSEVPVSVLCGQASFLRVRVDPIFSA